MATANKSEIEVKLVTDLKENLNTAKQLGSQVKFSDKGKSLYDATITRLEHLLSKGAFSASDLKELEKGFKSVTNMIIAAAGASEKFTKKIQDLKAAFEDKSSKAKEAKTSRSTILKTQLKQDEQGNYQLRESEANRIIASHNILSSKGKQIKTYSTLVKEKDSGNTAAQAEWEILQNKKNDLVKELLGLDTTIKQLTTDMDGLKTAIESAIGKSRNSIAKNATELGIEASDKVSQLSDQSNELPTVDVERTTADIDKMTISLDKQQTTLGKAFKAFSLYAIAIRTLKKAASEAVGTIKDLDKYLTEQAMVTGKSRKQTYELLSSYQDLAKQLGATTREVAEVATQFLRQGKTISESMKLSEAAVSAAKVAGISATESVNYLTTALNGFQLSAEDAMSVSDKFAAVASVSATSYEELATALSKVASQANLAGMSIDYTTALLAKGIETTREAPETIGTALKTVIARMREISDYGETLEDGMDLNNVATQLQYVGISLTNANGELRSTEDVLNELGGKWDTLNSNQQAAIAKALAGTRQQSRLIAMMTDYERVLELQEISLRSSGATAAQMTVYTDSMEAALNRVSTAWESIITAVTDSDVIISLIDIFSGILDAVGSILDKTYLLVPLVVSMGVLGAEALGRKIIETQLANQQNKLKIQEQKMALKDQKIEADIYLKKQKQSVLEKQKLLTEKQTTLEKYKQEQADAAIEGRQSKYSDEEVRQLENEIGLLENDIKRQENAEYIVSSYESQNKLLESQEGILSQLLNGTSSMPSIILAISNAWTSVTKAIKLAAQTSKSQHKQEMAQTTEATAAEGAKGGAKIIGQLGVYGIAIAAAVMAVFGVASALGGLASSATTSVVDQVNDLSAGIYNINKQITAIDSATSSYEDLDNQLIKTNEDLEEMKTLLDEVGDSLDDETTYTELGDLTAKAYYESFESYAMKYKSLEKIREVLASQAQSSYYSELDLLDKDTSWITGQDTDDLKMQEALLSALNYTMYTTIDILKEEKTLSEAEASSIESLTQSLLENMSVQEQYNLMSDRSGNLVKEFTKSVAALRYTIDGESISFSEIMESDDYTFIDRIHAYQSAIESSSGYTRSALQQYYSDYATFIDQLSMKSLEFVDSMQLTTDNVNSFYTAWEKLNKITGLESISEEQWTSNFGDMLEVLAETSNDITAAIEMFYGTTLNTIKAEKGLEAYETAFNALVNSFGNLIETGVLNMGQDIDKVTNTISNIYETASKWLEMTETEKTSFLSENAELFKTEGLLEAFESGNYDEIYKALSESEELQTQIEEQIAEIDKDLAVEEARVGEDRNEAYIKYLKDWKKNLENTTEIFRADLETLIDQQQAQLDIYKEYLEKQQEELEDSLNKRREAYEDYFNAINEEYDEEDYEQEAAMITANLSRLASSTNAASQSTMRELQDKLEDLEEERLQTLREEAQQAVLDDMDDNLTDINDKFDTLLNNTELLYEAMKSDMENTPQFLTNILTSALKDGQLTNLEAENFINELQSAFSSDLTGVDWDTISAKTENNQLVLNVNGTEQYIDSSTSASLYEQIKAILVQAGYGK